MRIIVAKFEALVNSNLTSDYKKKLDEQFFKEFGKAFNSFSQPKLKEIVGKAIDEFYKHPEGKRYTPRTGHFSDGRELTSINITNEGRAWEGYVGAGFTGYPVASVKGKWSRKTPWPGEKAWVRLFEFGEHGNPRLNMNIGYTSPTPYEIVNKEFEIEMIKFADEVYQKTHNKYQEKFVSELIGGYLKQCIEGGD